MVARVSTVAFEGVEARPIDVQVQIASGNVAFMIVGLGDKAVAESRERVRAALIASGLALPARRITVNLAPADMPKEGSHYDLPIALGVMAAIGAIPPDALQGYTVIGELALDGTPHMLAGRDLSARQPVDQKRPGPPLTSTFWRRARSSSWPIISRERRS
jgi:magnesium chelatase family protein